MEQQQTRQQLSLNGTWERRIDGQVWDLITVPSSLRPAGGYSLTRTVPLGKLDPDQRQFLHFEGITYHARVSINGKPVGEAGAYVPVDLDVSSAVTEGLNRISVDITDLPSGSSPDPYAAVGVNPGWEPYSGIIRDTWLETRPSAHVQNVRLAYELSDRAAHADCRARVTFSSSKAGTGRLRLTASYGDVQVASASADVALTSQNEQTHEVQFAIEQPALWSVEAPHLYRLSVELHVEGSSDIFQLRTGFRSFAIRGRTFEWNGNPLVLQGVCRHDMWYEQGFTLTREQMRQDMAAIKQLGANFVRLVHYPHHRYIVELAEELGLLVTEEPGFWQVDFGELPRSQVEAGLATLAATIQRDWNSPAVFGWFLGNESALTVEYLREGKALCDRLDPWRRPVSFANDRDAAKSRKLFEAAELAFFSEHLYGFDALKFDKTAEAYGAGKPLVIDEWGWEDAGHGQIVWERHFDFLLDLVEQGKIAGHSFWSWNDVRQYARVDWPTQQGSLLSGVVTEQRSPRPSLYERLALLFNRKQEFPEAARLGHVEPLCAMPAVVPLNSPVVIRGPKMPVPLQNISDSASAQNAWHSLTEEVGRYWNTAPMAKNQWQRTGKRLLFWKPQTIEVSGVPFDCPSHDGFVRPLVLSSASPELSIPIGRQCEQVYLLGNVTLPGGYPLDGKQGEIAATIDLRDDTGVHQILLRNGFEIARSNLIYVATRIEPLAVAAPRALIFTKDPAREQYQVLLLVVRTRGTVKDLLLRHKSGPPIALFGITTGAVENGGAAL